MATTVGNAKRRKCNIIHTGPIKELNFICGPLYGANLTTEIIGDLIANGKRVYEVNPEDKNDTYLLTDTDYMVSHFGKDEVPVVKQETPAPPVTPPTNDSLKVNPIPPKDNRDRNNGKGKNKHRNNNYQQNQQPGQQEEPAEATEEEVLQADM